MNYIIKYLDGSTTIAPATIQEHPNKITAYVSRTLFTSNVDYVDLCPDFLIANANDEGYAVVPRGTIEGGTMLCRFHPRKDCEYISDCNMMPVFGWKTAEQTIFAIVTGMTYEYNIVVGVKNGRYYLFPRFFVNDQVNYEDIIVEYHILPAGSDYNDMAAFYKAYKGLTPLAERMKSSQALSYAVNAPELRIRLCWKPVPAPVMHQTLENEPPVTVGCTLDRVKDILDGMKAKGIHEAEVCLVGMEVRGHDGRWPQLLPIEEAIGGQTQLEEVCKYGQSLGYQMVVHTNSTEMYEISDDWDESVLIKGRSGKFITDEIAWSGGQPFRICPKCTLKYTQRNLKDVWNMGFRGLHYIDVLTNVRPIRCFNPLHPVNRREAEHIARSIANEAQKMFGGFASEGGNDYMADAVDYVLYTAYNLLGKQPAICDELIPFWQLVYHGIILCNPGTETVNYTIKDPIHRLKFIEYGGRPLAYINSKYVDEGGCGNWMGEVDLLCSTDEQLAKTLDEIKDMYDEYRKLSHLQLEAMVRHEKVADGVYQVTYSDGSKITVNYNTGHYQVEKHEV